MKTDRQFYIGTSGWSYRHWRGPFYPEDLAIKKWLDYYIERFYTVEINSSFYHLPKEKTFEGWQKKVPAGFIFAVKGSRYITHVKKLNEPEEPVANFLERAKILKNKLGPILFQLPPSLKYNPERLENFLNVLPGKYRYTIEFRDESWWREDIYEMLQQHKIAFCIFELAGKRTPDITTTDFAYLRLHGPGGPYAGQYSENTLKNWAQTFRKWTRGKKKIFCYFDNDEKGYAAQDALKLNELLGNNS